MTRTRAPSRRWWVTSAGTFFLGVATAALIVAAGYQPHPPRVRTEIGEQRSVILKDGSVMYVNTDSDVAVNFSAGVRSIALSRGEARFVVARDAARPFVVTTPHTRVRATGTIFNVRIEPTHTAVAVLEGHVAVAGYRVAPSTPGTHPAGRHGRSSSHLRAGERGIITSDGELRMGTGPPMELVSGWPEHRLVFRSKPLVMLVAEINRYHQIPLRIADAELAGQQITLDVNAYDRASVIDYLRTFEGVSVETAADGAQVLTFSEPRRF